MDPHTPNPAAPSPIPATSVAAIRREADEWWLGKIESLGLTHSFREDGFESGVIQAPIGHVLTAVGSVVAIEPGGDGGPAFPHTYANGEYTTDGGMSLRDWFAGQALSGMFLDKKFSDALGAMGRDGINESAVAAKCAYRLADAMIAARRTGGVS